jgi:hypothetical protein
MTKSQQPYSSNSDETTDTSSPDADMSASAAPATRPVEDAVSAAPETAPSHPRTGWMARAVERKPLDLPRQPDTLDEAVEMIAEVKHLSPEALRHIRSDVRKVVRVIQATVRPTPRAIPCRPVELRPMMRCVLPARHGIESKRWSSIKAAVIRVLKLTGWLAADDELYAPMSPEWQTVTEMVARPAQRAVAAAFARHCTRNGIAPAEVMEATLEAYRAWRMERTLDLEVGVTLSQLRCILNRCRAVQGWPIRQLAAPPDPKRYVLPREQLDPGFLADLDTYLARLRAASPLNAVYHKKLAPLTLRDIDASLRRAASVLIAKGIAVQSLHDVLVPEHVEVVLLRGFNQLGDGAAWPSSMQTLAYTLRRAARQWGTLSPEQLARIDEIRRLTGSGQHAMSTKARDRVAKFDEDPRLLQAFFGLPSESFAAADLLFKEGKVKQAAHLHRTALSLALLQAKPMRRHNLATLEHERHFVPRGPLRYSELRIPGAETKSGVAIKAELSRPLAERVALHIDLFRPCLDAPDSPFLFAGPGGAPLDPRTVAQHITRLVEQQCGLRFNAHLMRHLSATILLDADPANLPVAQALLGHADAKTTSRAYAVQTTRSAQAKWMNILSEKVTATRKIRDRRSKGGR